MGHYFDEQTVPFKMLKHIYENLEDSPFNSALNPLKEGDPDWRERGYFRKID